MILVIDMSSIGMFKAFKIAFERHELLICWAGKWDMPNSVYFNSFKPDVCPMFRKKARIVLARRPSQFYILVSSAGKPQKYTDEQGFRKHRLDAGESF